jgi:hypothetical protein
MEDHMRRAVVLTLATCGVAAGCVVPVGEDCAPLVITEIMSSGESWEVPQVGEEVDFIELQNLGHEPVSLDGYGIDTLANPWVEAWLSESGESKALAGGERALLVASQYKNIGDWPTAEEAAGDDVPPEAFDVWSTILGIDINNDGSQVDLVRSPADGLMVVCQPVYMPDQHVQYSFSWQGGDYGEEGTWCDTEPTPGWENEPCLCDTTDRC